MANEPDPAAYYAIDDLTVTGDGEIVEIPVVDSERLAYLVRRRAAAKEQEVAWERTRRAIDRAILADPEVAAMGLGKLNTGGQVLSVHERVDRVLDLPSLMFEIQHAELTAEELRDILAAAASFNAARLPDTWRHLAAMLTHDKVSGRWVQTAPILRVAPNS